MRFPRLFLTVLLAAIATAAQGQGVNLMFAQPDHPFVAGTTNLVWLYVVNDSATDARVQMSNAIPCRLIISNQPPVETSLQSPPKTPSLLLVLGETFGRRAYVLSLPAGMEGRAALDFGGDRFNPITFTIASAAQVAAANAASGAVSPERKAEMETFATEPLNKFFQYFSPYEPIYFIVGSQAPTAKFQVSLKYHLFDPNGGVGRNVWGTSDLYFGYTQISLWDLAGPSSPFFDTSYKPGVFFYRPDLLDTSNRLARLDFQAGYQHESNGRDGLSSRSQNTLYVQPMLHLGREDSLFLTLKPRAWFYILDLSDNPDLPLYRGYADLTATVAWKNGWQLSTLVRIGDTGDHAALQFDLTYPLYRLRWLGGLTPYLQAQYFNGYGESLLGYNKRTEVWRIGLSLYR